MSRGIPFGSSQKNERPCSLPSHFLLSRWVSVFKTITSECNVCISECNVCTVYRAAKEKHELMSVLLVFGIAWQWCIFWWPPSKIRVSVPRHPPLGYYCNNKMTVVVSIEAQVTNVRFITGCEFFPKWAFSNCHLFIWITERLIQMGAWSREIESYVCFNLLFILKA